MDRASPSFARGAATPRIMYRGAGRSATAGGSTRAGTALREEIFARQLSAEGSYRPAPTTPRPSGPAWNHLCVTTSGDSTPARWRSTRASSPRPTTTSAESSTSSKQIGELENTLTAGDLRQRRQRRGRPARLPQRPASRTTTSESIARREPGGARCAGATRAPSRTTPGAGPGPATPPCDAGSGSPRRRRQRRADRALAGQRIAAKGEVRGQYAHITDVMPTWRRGA